MPEKTDLRVISHFDNRGIGEANESFKKLTKTWDKAQKRATKSGLFGIGLMKDKRQIRDVNNVFGKLKMQLAETMSEYNRQLDLLSGKKRDFGKGSEFQNVQGYLDKSERKIQSVTKAFDKLNKHKDDLMKQKEELKALPNVRDIQTRQVKLQTALSSINSKIKKLSTKTFSNNIDLVNTKIKDATERFDILAKQSASLKFKDLDDENWNKLELFVQDQEAINNEQNKYLHSEFKRLKDAENELQDKLNDTLNKRKTKNNTELINSIKNQLEQNKNEQDVLIDKFNILKVNTELLKNYKNSMTSAFHSRGKDYDTWKAGRDDLKRNTNWQMTQQSRLETFAIDSKNKIIPDSVIRDLERQKEKIKNELLEIKQQRKDALKNEAKKTNVDKELENTDIHIKRVETEFKNVTKEADVWKQRLVDVQDEVKHIKQQMEELKKDTNKYPTEQVFTSESLSKYNKDFDNLNRKWGALGGLVSRFQAKLAGIKGYMKQTTFFTRVWHKIWQNIYSQLASLINPLTLFRKAWNSWLDRFDNKALKNTFDMIKYNLVTAIAPLLKQFATLLLKITAIANVFIRKWTGVDLFDKSAWSLEQIKKGLGQLTAGFDELHASTDNPDALSTDFDKILDTGNLISPELENKLTGWANKISEAFDWIKKNWLTLVGLWAGFKIAKGLLDLLDWAGGLKSTLSGIGGIGFSKLLYGLSIVLGSIQLIKAAWDSIEWAKNFYGMNQDERIEQGKKNTKEAEKGGALTGAGIGGMIAGLPGAIVGATIGDGIAETISGAFNTSIAYWKGDTKATKEFATDLGEGIGKTAGAIAGGKLGASIGTAIAPGIGTAIGAVLGAAIGWAAGAVAGTEFGKALGDTLNIWSDFTQGSGHFQKMHVEAEDAANAFENAKSKLNEYNEALNKLNEMQEQTGESAEALYDMVQNGEKSYWGLTDAQKSLYDQYVKVQEAQKASIEANKQSFEISAKYEEQLAKESNNFSKYIAIMKDGYEQGAISHAEMVDYFAQTYATLDEEQRRIFVENMPKYMQQSIEDQYAKYLPGMEKLQHHVTRKWEDMQESIHTFFVGATNDLADFTATEEDLANTVDKLNEAQKNQIAIEEDIAALELETNQNAKELYESVQDGTIKYNALSDSEKTLIDRYVELQNAMQKTDICASKNAEMLVKLAYQSGQTSGDYTEFINTLIEENEKGNISAGEMAKELKQAYAGMSSDARKTFLEQIPADMRDGIKEGAADYMKGFEGFAARLGNKLTELGNAIGKFASKAWSVFERAGNWISGKGFKTNEQIQNDKEIEELRKKGITGGGAAASFDVGTNYVPNDGYAYIHQGEAVIPKKYNKPYKPTDSNDSQLLDAVNKLTTSVSQMKELVNQGIPVKGQFVQRGSDLVATVERANNKLSNSILNQKQYAR